jgi:hypothetical protein
MVMQRILDASFEQFLKFLTDTNFLLREMYSSVGYQKIGQCMQKTKMLIANNPKGTNIFFVLCVVSKENLSSCSRYIQKKKKKKCGIVNLMRSGVKSFGKLLIWRILNPLRYQ